MSKETEKIHKFNNLLESLACIKTLEELEEEFIYGVIADIKEDLQKHNDYWNYQEDYNRGVK